MRRCAAISGDSASLSRRARASFATYHEFRAWWEGRLASSDLQATPHALQVAPLVAFEQPVPMVARGNLALQNLIITGTLPPRVREIYGLSWTPAHEVALRALAANHRLARHFFPRQLRRGRNDFFFDVVIKSEQARGGTPRPIRR